MCVIMYLLALLGRQHAALVVLQFMSVMILVASMQAPSFLLIQLAALGLDFTIANWGRGFVRELGR